MEKFPFISSKIYVYFLIGICPPLSFENGRLGYDRIVGGGKYPVDAKAQFSCDSNYSQSTGRRFDIRFCTASGNCTGQVVTCDLGKIVQYI